MELKLVRGALFGLGLGAAFLYHKSLKLRRYQVIPAKVALTASSGGFVLQCALSLQGMRDEG
jgi:hypothetical protein